MGDDPAAARGEADSVADRIRAMAAISASLPAATTSPEPKRDDSPDNAADAGDTADDAAPTTEPAAAEHAAQDDEPVSKDSGDQDEAPGFDTTDEPPSEHASSEDADVFDAVDCTAAQPVSASAQKDEQVQHEEQHNSQDEDQDAEPTAWEKAQEAGQKVRQVLERITPELKESTPQGADAATMTTKAEAPTMDTADAPATPQRKGGTKARRRSRFRVYLLALVLLLWMAYHAGPVVRRWWDLSAWHMYAHMRWAALQLQEHLEHSPAHMRWAAQRLQEHLEHAPAYIRRLQSWVQVHLSR